MAFVLAMLMFSLAGIPPLAGFFAKFYVFLAAVKAGLYALAVIGVLASVVGAYYYLRIVKFMYFDEPARGLRRRWIGEVKLRGLCVAAPSRCSSCLPLDRALDHRGRRGAPPSRSIEPRATPDIRLLPFRADRFDQCRGRAGWRERGERGPCGSWRDEQTGGPRPPGAQPGCREPGNLYATFLLSDRRSGRRPRRRSSFVAALARA